MTRLPALSLCFPLLLVVGVAGNASAQDWPNWRGPNYNGSTSAKDLPVEFSRQKLVKWSAPMPGPGASTPIVVGDKIFLTSVDTERDRLVAMCVDRNDGKIIWQKDAGSGYGADSGGSRTGGGRATYASPSAATDGEVVVFFFGNGDLVGYDYGGKELWRRNIQAEYGKFAFNWTFSASPTMWEGKVFLPVLQRDRPTGRGGGGGGRGRGRGQGGRRGGFGSGLGGQGGGAEPQRQAPAKIESFILAADPKTGKTIYKHVRPCPAQMESMESYTTTIPHVGKDGRKELLLVGGDVLTGHDPANGEELWRWGTWNPGHRQRAWRLVPTVVVGAGVAVICAPKRAPVFAVKLGGKGEIPQDDGLVWQSDGRPNAVSSDVPTPAFDGAHFYVLSDVQNALSKVNPKDGEVLWTRNLSRDFLWRASPTVADGKVFCMNHNGEVVVVDAETGKIQHHAFLGDEDDDQTRASIVVAHNNVFVRTNAALFCFASGV